MPSMPKNNSSSEKRLAGKQHNQDGEIVTEAGIDFWSFFQINYGLTDEWATDESTNKKVPKGLSCIAAKLQGHVFWQTIRIEAVVQTSNIFISEIFLLNLIFILYFFS